jgi:hypothetical protein
MSYKAIASTIRHDILASAFDISATEVAVNGAMFARFIE